MPSSCCVIGCKSRGTSQAGIGFFQLPLNKPTVLTQWLIVLDRRDWIPKPSSRICSLHFSNDDYLARPHHSTPRLKPDAIPSLFPDLGANDEEEEPVKNDQENIIKEEPVEDKPAPIKNKVSPVSTPVSETPSQRPRRISKVSSKMKDFILLDDIKKHRHHSPAVTGNKGNNEASKSGDTAAQELLSILEDSNSLSGDENKSIVSTPKSRQYSAVSETKKTASGSVKESPKTRNSPGTSSGKLSSSSSTEMKPAPASVKKAKALALLQKGEKGKVKSQSGSKAKPTVPVEYRKTYFQVKDGDKVLFLTYADLNPVTDMTKNNLLLGIANPNTFQDLSLDFSKSKNLGNVGLGSIEPDLPSVGDKMIENPQSVPPKKKKTDNTPLTSDVSNCSMDINDNATSSNTNVGDLSSHEDQEVIDSDTGSKSVGSPPITKVSKNFKVTSPIKRKKRFKTVAEIVVRTDHSGQVPNVSIEKMTNLESSETPRKKSRSNAKLPVQKVATPPSEDDELANLSDRITETIKKMKLLERVKGNTAKLTVLITTLPPVQENELLIIKKKNTDTNVEMTRELRVAISSYKSPPETSQVEGSILPENNPINTITTNNNLVPILGACDSDPVVQSSTADHTPVQKDAIDSTENVPEAGKKGDSQSDQNPPSISNEDENSEATGVTTSAPLQHDHTYISPSLKVAGEFETTGDDAAKETVSKLKLSEDELAYRSKVHKKLRFLKETVKRKNETINKMKQKLICLEKSLRDERKSKKKINLVGKRKMGYESNSLYESILEGGKSLDFNSDLPLEFDENLEDSEDEGRGSRSPITYICEPAIDVCEKITPQE